MTVEESHRRYVAAGRRSQCGRQEAETAHIYVLENGLIPLKLAQLARNRDPLAGQVRRRYRDSFNGPLDLAKKLSRNVSPIVKRCCRRPPVSARGRGF